MGQECLLLLQRTGVLFQNPHRPLTSACNCSSGGSNASGICGHLHSQVHLLFIVINFFLQPPFLGLVANIPGKQDFFLFLVLGIEPASFMCQAKILPWSCMPSPQLLTSKCALQDRPVEHYCSYSFLLLASSTSLWLIQPPLCLSPPQGGSP